MPVSSESKVKGAREAIHCQAPFSSSAQISRVLADSSRASLGGLFRQKSRPGVGYEAVVPKKLHSGLMSFDFRTLARKDPQAKLQLQGV